MGTNWELKREIRERGLRQGFFADQAGIKEDRFSRIVHGRIRATPEERRSIRRLLGRDVFSGTELGTERAGR